jgi:hypothetical protein
VGKLSLEYLGASAIGKIEFPNWNDLPGTYFGMMNPIHAGWVKLDFF